MLVNLSPATFNLKQANGRTKREEMIQLKRYTMYAVGCPLIITLVTATVEYLPPTVHVIRPNFGVWRCYFDQPLPTFIYLYLPIAVVQTANIIFFALTILNLKSTWNLTRSIELKREHT